MLLFAKQTFSYSNGDININGSNVGCIGLARPPHNAAVRLLIFFEACRQRVNGSSVPTKL